MLSKTIIVADGDFPKHEIPLQYLRNAARIVCCDGSVEKLLAAGMKPYAIVGDMDSLDAKLASEFADRIHVDKNQETNDLTKSVLWCREMNFNDLVILGATGKREDHTLGNISLLADYAEYVNVIMVTDTGTFLPFNKSCKLLSFPGQQISLFSIDPETEITSTGLKYPLTHNKLKNWWVATLNESLGNNFSLEFSKGAILVYMKFPE